MGAATGNQRGTKGMPEVQKPVLEHAPTEAQNPQVTGDILTQNSTVATDDFRALNVPKTDGSKRPFIPKSPTSGRSSHLTACVSEHFVEL